MKKSDSKKENLCECCRYKKMKSLKGKVLYSSPDIYGFRTVLDNPKHHMSLHGKDRKSSGIKDKPKRCPPGFENSLYYTPSILSDQKVNLFTQDLKNEIDSLWKNETSEMSEKDKLEEEKWENYIKEWERDLDNYWEMEMNKRSKIRAQNKD